MATTLYDSKHSVELTPLADAERRTCRTEVLSLRRFRVITSDQARAMFAEIDKLIFRRETMREYDPDRNVKVICGGCKREHIMRASVEYFKCPCTPHEERSAHIGRQSLS